MQPAPHMRTQGAEKSFPSKIFGGILFGAGFSAAYAETRGGAGRGGPRDRQTACDGRPLRHVPHMWNGTTGVTQWRQRLVVPK